MSGNALLLFAIAVALSFLLLHFINHWQTKRMVSKILRDVKDGKPPKPRNYDFEILFDSNGVSVRSLKDNLALQTPILWNKIQKATAFKRDLFTVDCICLLLETSGTESLEVNEDMKGWLEFTEAMPKYLPSCIALSDWIFKVADPAFAPNPTIIYSARH